MSELEEYEAIKKFLVKFQNMSFKEQNKLLKKFDKKIEFVNGAGSGIRDDCNFIFIYINCFRCYSSSLCLLWLL